MTGRRVLGIGLDPYTIDFDSDFYRGKPLNGDVIAGGIKADEARILGMGHDFEWLLINPRGGAKAASAAARAALAARPVDVVVIGGGVRRSGSDAGAGGASERGDRRGAWGEGGIQYVTDRYRGGDWAGFGRGVVN
jgi:hypothetical protein